MAVAANDMPSSRHGTLSERLVFPTLEPLVPLPELGNSLLPQIDDVFRSIPSIVVADESAAVHQRNVVLVAELHVLLVGHPAEIDLLM